LSGGVLWARRILFEGRVQGAPGFYGPRAYLAGMSPKSIGTRLILLASVAFILSCGPKAVSDPPPRTAASVPTDADAGLPMVPLTGRGVAVPSDVKLEPAPNPPTPPASAPLTGAPASPGAN
jgi:hypothetical protein